MSNHLRALPVMLAIVLAGCFLEFNVGEGFLIASAAQDPVQYAIANESTEGPDPTLDPEPVSGVSGTEILTDAHDDCDRQHLTFLLILDGETGQELHRREFNDQPVCDGDRLLWTGEDLVKLDDGLVFGLFGDTWPDGLYVAPFAVASTAEDPVVVEHGPFRRGSGFEPEEERPVDGVTHFTPATICEPNGASYSVRLRDAASREILAGAPWHGREFCEGGRLLWNGEELKALEEDEPWPPDLHDTK